MLGQRILCRNAREHDQHGSDSTLQDTGHGAYEVRACLSEVNLTKSYYDINSSYIKIYSSILQVQTGHGKCGIFSIFSVDLTLVECHVCSAIIIYIYRLSRLSHTCGILNMGK